MEAFEAIISLLVIGFALFARMSKSKRTAKNTGTTGGWDKMIQPPASPEKPVILPPGTAAPMKASAQTQNSTDFQSGFMSRPAAMMAAEGVDPCHDDLYAPRNDGRAENPAANLSSAAQELVRGFVMAEVLAQPRFRRTVRK